MKLYTSKAHNQNFTEWFSNEKSFSMDRTQRSGFSNREARENISRLHSTPRHGALR